MSDALATPEDPRTRTRRDALDLAARLAAERYDELAGRVVDLSDPETVWLVIDGRVDVRAVPLRDGEIRASGRHIFEATPGHLLPGTPPRPAETSSRESDALALRGRCGAGTILYRTTRTKLRALSLDLEALVAIERWVNSMAIACAPDTRVISTDLMEADPGLVYAGGAVLRAPHQTIVWVELVAGTGLALSDPMLRLAPGMAAWPLTEATWLALPDGATVNGYLTPARMLSGRIWDDLDAFGQRSLQRLRHAVAAAATDHEASQSRRAAWTRARFDAGLFRLGHAAYPTLSAPASPISASDAWGEAFALVAAASGIVLAADDARAAPDIEERALASGVAFRSVALEDGWWRSDGGPMLGFQIDGEQRHAVALLPRGANRYRAARRSNDQGVPVDAAFARTLAPTALTLYRPLPSRIAGLMTLLRFGARGLGRDLGTILLMGLLTGVVGMLTPIASGVLMQDVLPRADLSLHVAVIAGLGAAALGNAAFSVVEAIATTRVQARVDLAAQAGVWSRLLRLPTRFFRAHATGDLADRANGVSEIRRAVTGAATQSVLSGLFSLLSGGLLFWYNLRLALLAIGFTLLVVAIEALLFVVELPRRRAVTAANGKVDAVAFETLSAMPKLRAAAAEPRAFARWSDDFADQARARRRAANVDILRDVLGGVIPLFATALLFAGAIGLLGGGAAGAPAFTFGEFVAFQAAFGNFIGGVMSLVGASETLVAVAPVWERLRPILNAAQETGVGRAPVGTLRGMLAVSNVTFAYDAAAAPALTDVSLTIQAGEYVAFVGHSGSGKSTLIRVLLGLEQPQTGAAYVDGMDLSTIDLAAMRRQFGVVMQGGQLIAGNIMENILGSAPLTEARAWEAARQAGLEADIRAMPMQMYTVVAEGGGGLSGGQKQRLLIARALARRPRVLLFDEATSALDNATQSEVKQTLDRLNVTRIVVAHRLSTVRDVHRIVVMRAGRIVEEGTYDSLIERRGLFSRLAARQLA